MMHVNISQRQENQNDVDGLPRDHKVVVHEFGYPIYRALIAAGVRHPAKMRQLVFEIWQGARGSARGSKPRGFAGASNLAQLDWLLIQSGSNVSAAALLRILRHSGLVVVPLEPSQPMIEASMAEVSGGNVTVSKPRKHAMRMRAAVEACIDHYWPFLRKEDA